MTVSEFIEEYDMDDESSVIMADGLEEAFIGLSYRFNDGPVATYDREKIIEIYVRDGMSYEEAEEYFGFNVLGAWVGEKTPVFMIPYKRKDD
jgi:hypothetical protein